MLFRNIVILYIVVFSAKYSLIFVIMKIKKFLKVRNGGSIQ